MRSFESCQRKRITLGLPTQTLRSAAVLVATLFSLIPVIAEGAKPGIRDLSPLLETHRAKQSLPAVGAIVVTHEGVVARGVAGVRKLGDDTKVQLTDRWHLGSDTKAMTATMVAALVEKGKLSWKLTIAEVLPDLAPEMRDEYKNVTLEMLLAHRGGIGSEHSVDGLWDKLWKREAMPVEERHKMAKAMLAVEPAVKPGDYFYSNCGYGIAAHMAETVTKTPWETLMKQYVFEPLGMKSAGFGVPWADEPPTDPWPHSARGVPTHPGPMADNPPSIGPGGTVHASLDDWARFVIDQLRGDRGDPGTLLRPSTYKHLHKGIKTGEGDTAYALGWQVVQRDWCKGPNGGTGRCLTHAGSNNSWFAIVWIAPERDFAVLCTTNMGGHGVFERIDAVCWEVIEDQLRHSR